MVQELRRVLGRVDARVLGLLALFILIATLGLTVAQLVKADDDPQSVATWDDIVKRYLVFREDSYQMVVPSWYLAADQVEEVWGQEGFAGFQNQPDWFWTFDSGILTFSAKSALAQQVKSGTRVVIYEDMTTGELVISSLPETDGAEPREEIVFKSLPWAELDKSDTTTHYLARELSKRRIVWQVTLKDEAQAQAEAEAVALMALEDEGGGMMQMMSGGTCSEITFTAIELSTNTVDVGLCIPDGITNVDIFASTNLMPDGFPWVMVATNLPVTTNSVVWSWSNLEETNVFLAAGDASQDTDGDGLTDAREFYVYGTEMNAWDTDGDSYSDGEEVQWGSNPLDIQNMPLLGRGVVINEVLYDPSGTDAGKEWVEFFNTNRVPVDMTGFIIQVGSNVFGDAYTFPTGTVVQSGDFLLVGGSSVSNANHVVEFNMLNRGSSGPTAGLRLITPSVTSNRVVDALLYAPNNSNNLPTDGFGTNGLGPYANSGQALARIRVGYETDHASDWMYTASLTPTAQGELPDIDGDGISNSVEIAGYMTGYGFRATDYNNADTDFDDFTDGEEWTNSPPTDPLVLDTDGDMFPWGSHGIDGDEVHNLGTDPTNPDSDGDGLPDGWEAALGLDPTDADSDNDGTSDSDEDTDGDGMSNGAEMSQNSNPVNPGSSQPQDYRLVLYHLPQPGWGSGDDMGTATWIGYRFENVTRTAGVAFVIADGGSSNELFSVSWKNVVGEGETGGRTNVVWATLMTNAVPELIITDGGTTWPNENPTERGADLSVELIQMNPIAVHSSDTNSFFLFESNKVVNIATIKGTGDVSMVTSISPDTAQIRAEVNWQGAAEDGADPLQATVSRTAAVRQEVNALIGGAILRQAVVWVIWSDITVRHSGGKTPHDSGTDTGNDKDFPSYAGSTNLGPENLLGASPRYLGWKVEMMGQLEPSGVNEVVSSGWDFYQTLTYIDFLNNTNASTGTGVDAIDTVFNAGSFQDQTADTNDRIYALDGPGILSTGFNQYKSTDNFKVSVRWNGKTASDEALWWIQQKAENQTGTYSVIENDGGDGTNTVENFY